MAQRAARKNLITIIMVAIIALIMTFCGQLNVPAFAYSDNASGVLTDLKKDPTFNPAKFSVDADDTAINVIQIAESDAGELLIYTHQPSGQTLNLIASSINIARAMNNSTGLSFRNYKLTYLNADGVFFKYSVEGFELDAGTKRFYNISNILRPFNSAIDKPSENGNTGTEVKNAVGQLWTATTNADGSVSYSMRTSETINITEMYVGFTRLYDGFNPWGYHSSTDAHFVAFDTDKRIDKLMSAQLEYKTQKCTEYAFPAITSLGDISDPINLTLYSDENVQNSPEAWNAHSYSWKKIQTVTEFKSWNTENDVKSTMTKGAEKDLNSCKWVLRFTATDYQQGVGSTRSTRVSDVIILRLKFETDGVVYDLGVVSNKQTGSIAPSFTTTPEDPIPWWVWLIIGVVAVVLVVVFLPKLLIWLIELIIKLLLLLLKWLVKIITAPFRLLTKNHKE